MNTEFRMDPELKAEWIEALRSGEFAQGKGKLIQHVFGQREYCCLGVLCEIRKEQLIAAGIAFKVDNNGYTVISSSEAYPDHRVREALGLPYDFWEFTLVTLGGDEIEVKLDVLNDDDVTFNQIADLINYAF